MKNDKIVEFLLALGCKGIKAYPGSDWVKACCPLSPWFHKDKGNLPVFGVKVPKDENEAPYYHCYACGMSGILPRLMHNLHWLSGRRYGEAERILSSMPVLEGTKIRKRRRRVVKDKYNIFNAPPVDHNLIVPHKILEKFPLLAENDDIGLTIACDWITDTTGMSMQALEKYQLCFYQCPATRDIGIVFPIRNDSGDQVIDLWVEMIDTGEFFRLDARRSGSLINYHGHGQWFGHRNTNRPVVLVGKPIDALRLNALGIPNVMASCGKVREKHLSSIRSQVVYVAFSANIKGRENAKFILGNLESTSKYYLNWGLVGIKSAREIKNISEFRRVFDARIKIR